MTQTQDWVITVTAAMYNVRMNCSFITLSASIPPWIISRDPANSMAAPRAAAAGKGILFLPWSFRTGGFGVSFPFSVRP